MCSTHPPGNREVKCILAGAIVAAGLCGFILWSTHPTPPVLAIIYILPVIPAVLLTFALRLLRCGIEPIHYGIAIAGAVFIVGGAAFDMVATVIHSPDLRMEGNVVARMLIRSGHKIATVYVYAIVAQSLMIALDIILWFSLIRHRRLLIESLDRPENFAQFIKAATGGAYLTWRQWSAPLNLSELGRIYPPFWLLVILVVAASSDRWYLGLKWFNVVSGNRTLVLSISLISACLGFYTWLWVSSQRNRKADYKVPPPIFNKPGGWG